MYVGFGKISAQLHTLIIMHTPTLRDFRHCFEEFVFCHVFFQRPQISREESDHM